ncbi:unnamed protein product [Eruca vesicaria subsp. sativa]|uniref:F-box/LRR-repeat protein 15/At3g58940/PEG3-like LRR domain-containing protein n=1 Tax=Eruca vesicaria subsp. sativa TaxID=29727 RepID=A0ABC8L9Y5_ERUVS|nr:unnamed protein product [Eruca vesicaria subsp. sativa]
MEACMVPHTLRQLTARDINQTLSFYRPPKITSFNLRIPRYVRGPEIDRWIEFIVSRNVEKLTLVFNNQTYSFPDSFYLSSSFAQLCIHYPSKVAGCTVSWKYLRKLTLWDCNLCEEESIQNILSGSPILETLKLKYCRGPQRLDLSKPRSLRRLVIYFGAGPTEIVAPHLQYLSLRTFNERTCTLVDVSSLAEAKIHIAVDNYGPPLKLDFLQTMVLKLLAKLHNVKRLTFTGTVLQILSLVELRGVPFPTFKVQTLTVETGFTRSVIPGLGRLLQNSPELEKLTAQATTRLVGIPERDLDSYMDSEGLNPDRCGRSKYEAFPTLFEFVSVISCKDATWRLMASFMEMVMRNVKTLETLVVGLECIKPKGSDARWFEELLQMLQLLSNNNNVSIVLKR